MVNVRHRPLLVNVHVQPLGAKVLRYHLPGLDDAARLGEVSFAEDLGVLVLAEIVGRMEPDSVVGW